MGGDFGDATIFTANADGSGPHEGWWLPLRQDDVLPPLVAGRRPHRVRGTERPRSIHDGDRSSRRIGRRSLRASRHLRGCVTHHELKAGLSALIGARVLAPRRRGLVDRQLKLELFLVIYLEQGKPVGDRQQTRDSGVASRSSETSAPWTTFAIRLSAGPRSRTRRPGPRTSTARRGGCSARPAHRN